MHLSSITLTSYNNNPWPEEDLIHFFGPKVKVKYEVLHLLTKKKLTNNNNEYYFIHVLPMTRKGPIFILELKSQCQIQSFHLHLSCTITLWPFDSKMASLILVLKFKSNLKLEFCIVFFSKSFYKIMVISVRVNNLV